jgi:iron complex transport system permease protein
VTPCCRPPVLFLLLLGAALVSLALALAGGSQGLAELWDGEPGRRALLRELVLELRLPRALCAFAVGGLLALAGVLMQVLLRNPLGDPYVLGVSGGAACAAVLALALGLPAAALTGVAFAGALGAMLLVFFAAGLGGPGADLRLLLTGVVLAAGWGALVSLVLALSPSARLPGMLFWLMGDLTDADQPLPALGVLAAASLAALVLARPLDLLQQGEAQAAVLGVATTGLRATVFLLGSLVTAAAVALAGSVGFVGLVVPHMFRLLGGGAHRLLIPGAVLLGGTLLLLADTLARTLLAPRQLPVGVITALLGVPLFLYLLNRGPRPG